MKNLITLILVFSSVTLFSQNGSIKGKVTDTADNSPMPMATWELFGENDSVIEQGATDYQGDYEILNLAPGKHVIQFSFIGYKSVKLQVDVNVEKVSFVNANLTEGVLLGEIPITYYADLIKPDGPTDVIIDSKVLDNLPSRYQGIDQIAGNLSSDVVHNEQTGSLYVRGSRDGTVMYVIDGVKMTEPARIPASSIAEMRVITSGIPAEFGDVTGGVIYITTKSYFYTE